MKIRGILAGQVSGSIAGITGSHNKGGYYLRNRTVPTNGATPARASQRAAFGAALQGWGALTPEYREQWKTAAQNQPWTDSFGENITLTGQQWYVGVNSLRLRINEEGFSVPAPLVLFQPPTPGTRPTPQMPTSITWEQADDDTAASPVLAFPQSQLGANDLLVVYASGPVGPGVESPPNAMQMVGTATGATTSLTVSNNARVYQVGVRIGVWVQIIRGWTGSAAGAGQYSKRLFAGFAEVTTET